MLTICYYIYYFMCLAILLDCLSVCTPCLCIFFGGITEVTNACELPRRCRKSNLGPLENQPVLLALGRLHIYLLYPQYGCICEGGIPGTVRGR